MVVPDAVLNSKEMHPFPAMATHRAAHWDNELPEEVPSSLEPVHPDPVVHQTSAALTTEGNSASNCQSKLKRVAERLVVQLVRIILEEKVK